MSALDHKVAVELPPVEPVTNGRPNPNRVYYLAGMGPGVRSEYVRILKYRAWQELDRQAEYINSSRFNRLEVGILRDMGAGKYEWADDVFNSIDGTRAGFSIMLLARLRTGTDEDVHDSVVDELLEKIGFDRLLALIQQADGPQIKNSSAPAASGGAIDTTTKS